LGQRGLTDLPRDSIIQFTRTATDNMIYVTAKNHYINMSWGENIGFKTFKLILDDEQRAKIFGSREIINEEIT
jgi:hypothetical protein